MAKGDPIEFATSQVGWQLNEGERATLDRGLGVLGTAVCVTTDGGRTWTTVYRDPTGIWGMDLLTTQDGWVVGVTSLVRTTEGGATWTVVGEPAGTHLVVVDFVTPSLGYGLTTKGTLVRSDDGGETWGVLPTFAPLQSICFTSAGSGIAASMRTAQTPQNRYTTKNGGTGLPPASRTADYAAWSSVRR